MKKALHDLSARLSGKVVTITNDACSRAVTASVQSVQQIGSIITIKLTKVVVSTGYLLTALEEASEELVYRLDVRKLNFHEADGIFEMWPESADSQEANVDDWDVFYFQTVA